MNVRPVKTQIRLGSCPLWSESSLCSWWVTENISFLRANIEDFDQIELIPGLLVQSVTCLTSDASLTADPGVAISIAAWSHTFMEIDHEIISMVILLPSAESFKKDCCQLQAKVCVRSAG